MAGQPAADDGASPADAAPAVDVYGFVLRDGTVDDIENAGGLGLIAGSGNVGDGEALMSGFANQVGVREEGIAPFSFFGQVEEKGDSGREEGVDLLLRALFLQIAGIFTGNEFAGLDDVTIRDECFHDF